MFSAPDPGSEGLRGDQQADGGCASNRCTLVKRPAESAGQGRSSPKGHREPGLPYPADRAVPQGPSSTQPPWSCVAAARLQAQSEKKDEEMTI